MNDADTIRIELPARAYVHIHPSLLLTGKARCMVENETRNSYWVRWLQTVPNTRIKQGAIDVISKKHVRFEGETE